MIGSGFRTPNRARIESIAMRAAARTATRDPTRSRAPRRPCRASTASVARARCGAAAALALRSTLRGEFTRMRVARRASSWPLRGPSEPIALPDSSVRAAFALAGAESPLGCAMPSVDAAIANAARPERRTSAGARASGRTTRLRMLRALVGSAGECVAEPLVEPVLAIRPAELPRPVPDTASTFERDGAGTSVASEGTVVAGIAAATGAGAGAGGASGGATVACGSTPGSEGGAGGAAGAGGGLGALRGGSKLRGSTYVSSSPMRIPRWTYGTSCSASPEGPGSASASPSPTCSPRLTRSAPRCVSDALYPSSVAIVTVNPWVGSDPAKVTSPETGASAVAAVPSATSMPRCCPPAYLSLATENPRRTAPSPGQAHAHAWPPDARAHESATPRKMHDRARRLAARCAAREERTPGRASRFSESFRSSVAVFANTARP